MSRHVRHLNFLGIKDPAVADPDTVFAMINTVEAGGIIQPSLYRIDGTGTPDLVRSGDVSVTEFPGENTLLISCQWADLVADPIFQTWYDPNDPSLDVAGFTQKISLLGGARKPTRPRVAFDLPRSQAVKLAIYDNLGRHVVTLLDANLDVGNHSRIWDGRDHSGRPQPAGIYFYYLKTSGKKIVQRIALVR